MKHEIQIKPFGECALLIEWPKQVNPAILNDMMRLRNGLVHAGFAAPHWDLVPAYRSMALISNAGPIAARELEASIRDLYNKEAELQPAERYLWHLPVCYASELGPDLEEVSRFLKINPDELIKRHTSHNYVVYGIGFLPGFTYLGGVPPQLETERRKEPRLNVKKGSVGLAGKQTGIYPQDSPGGWNIIGNCPIPMFSLAQDPPCFVSVGDQVRFYPVSKAEHELLTIEAQVGVFNLKKEALHD